jgi:hypothetical protein
MHDCDNRRRDVQRFYAVLADLEHRLGGTRTLATANGRLGWPQRGIYLFFEPGQVRRTSGSGLRVVRVGTHAVAAGSRSTLWGRLHAHQGQLSSGGGQHRASVLRRHGGSALMRHDVWPAAMASQWQVSQSASREVRLRGHPLEIAVSRYIGTMPLPWLAVENEPGPDSLRGHLERHTIALLSNYARDPIDPPTTDWLGRYAGSELCSSTPSRDIRHIETGQLLVRG